MGLWSDERERALKRFPACNGAIVLARASARGIPMHMGIAPESDVIIVPISLQRPARR
jgi:hypothetical protein